MSSFFSPNQDAFQYINPPFFTEIEALSLSKQRIIQRNLVHFHGFPDRLYDKELLYSKEYFGQYGVILKIILTYKLEKGTNKRLNSAYITYSTNEEAAYAILAVDSIKIDNILVRAFFGTTKYCHHFLNNYQCFNIDKCIFSHEIAEPCDIIEENSKFGYSEHIKLAKKIIKFGSEESQTFVMKNANKEKTCLPNLLTIYQKKDILMKTKNHRKKKEKCINTISNYDTGSSSGSSNSNKDLIVVKQEPIINSINNEEKNFKLFKSRNHSRFEFANNNPNKENKNEKNNVSKTLRNVVDKLTSRLSFFIPFSKEMPMKILEIEFCNKLYEQNKNNELKNIITNSM
jgi:hypothetical protein